MTDDTRIILKIGEDVASIKAKIESSREDVVDLKVRVSALEKIESNKEDVADLKVRVAALEKTMYKIIGGFTLINVLITFVPHFFK